MSIQTVAIPRGSGQKDMRGWLALPNPDDADNEDAPGVLVIHEIHGLIENQKAILERFAANGYVALAPDLYDGSGPKALCVVRSMLSMWRGKGAAMKDLRFARKFLEVQPQVDASRLGAAGFCMGGGFALLMALEPGISAVAPYYGSTPTFFKAKEPSCPVIGGFGGRDMIFAPLGKKLEKHLNKRAIPNDVKHYPKAGHSYMTKERGGFQEWLAALPPMRVGYNHDAAEDSWERMLSFFGEHI